MVLNKYPKMNPEIKDKWVEALESDKYKQGDGLLKTTDNYDSTYIRHCCLGVLCELAIEDGLELDIRPPGMGEDQSGYTDTWEYDGSVEVLPEAVREWAGMQDNLGRFYENDDYEYWGEDGDGQDGYPSSFESLADMNDKGLTFKQIAEVIKKEF